MTCTHPALAASARLGPWFAIAALCAPAFAVQSKPQIAPGTLTVFPDAPNAVGGSCTDPLIGFCDVVEGETPLRAFARGFLPGAKGAATVYQYHELGVPDADLPGGVGGSVIEATVAGSVRVRGFLFTMGGASASASIDLQLLDVTLDPDAPQLVWSGNVAEYGENSLFGITLGASGGINLEGGFPYIGGGAGGEVGFEFAIEPDLQMIRDELDFGFDLKLVRGHSYRLQLVLSVATHNRIGGGSSIASFFSEEMGGPVVPNALDPQPSARPGQEATWLSLLTQSRGGRPALFRGRVNNYGMTKGDADLVSGSFLGFPITIWEQGLASSYNVLSSSESDKQQRSDRFLAHVFGMPMGSALTPAGLLSSDFARVENDTMTETVELPGVELTGLVLTAGNDPAEQQRRATNLAFEEHLARGTVLASFLVPASAGGELDNLLALVDQMILQFQQAGLATNNAPFFRTLAKNAFTAGDYRLAYTRTRQAYQLLVGGS